MSGAAFGRYGGELTAIAYCVAHPGPLLTTVSTSFTVPHRGTATATTPRCPADRQLTAGGFSFHGSRAAFFASGSILRSRRWSVTAYGYAGSVPTATAYAYCIRP